MKRQVVFAAVILNCISTLCLAGVITPYNAHGSSRYSTSYDFDRTIDGSGLTAAEPYENSTHTAGGTVAANLYWLSGWVDDFSTTPTHLQFDFAVEETPFDVSGMLFWNMNEVYISGGNTYDQTDRGIKDVEIVLSVDNDATNGDGITDDWKVYLTLDKAPGLNSYVADVYDFGQTYSGIRFVQINVLSNWGYSNPTNGDQLAAVAEVRFLGEAVPEPATLILLGIGSMVLIRRR